MIKFEHVPYVHFYTRLRVICIRLATETGCGVWPCAGRGWRFVLRAGHRAMHDH